MEDIVTFSGLNLQFKINKIAFNIGNIEVSTYAFLIVFAFIIGIVYCLIHRKYLNLEWDDVLILSVIIIVFSLIGARLYYVLFKIGYYIKKPIEIFSINKGGLAIYGGIIGAFLGIYIYSKIKKKNLLNLLDFIVPVLPLGQAIGRWGNFFNMEAHGYETTSIFRMGIYENGNFIEVHPTFLYESIICFIIFIVLLIIKDKTKFKGELFFIYLVLYGTGRAFIEGLRTDSLMFGNFRVSQILSILLVIFGVVMILVNKVKRKDSEK